MTLRRMDPRVHNLACLAAQWKDTVQDMTLLRPMEQGYWVQLKDKDNQWTGWIFLYDVLAGLSPQMSGRALTEKTANALLNLLIKADHRRLFPLQDLNVEQIIFTQLLNGSPANRDEMLRVRAENITLWLESFAPVNPEPVPGTLITHDLRWPVEFIIGHTLTTLSTLRKCECNDVIIIKEKDHVIRIHNKALTRFIWKGEDIVIDECIPEDEYITRSQSELNAFDEERLPVKMEFVLHSAEFTLGELKTFHENKIMTLPVDAEKSITILTNGALAGKGEVVELEGHLGVQITSWFLRRKDDQ